MKSLEKSARNLEAGKQTQPTYIREASFHMTNTGIKSILYNNKPQIGQTNNVTYLFCATLSGASKGYPAVCVDERSPPHTQLQPAHKLLIFALQQH